MRMKKACVGKRRRRRRKCESEYEAHIMLKEGEHESDSDQEEDDAVWEAGKPSRPIGKHVPKVIVCFDRPGGLLIHANCIRK